MAKDFLITDMWRLSGDTLKVIKGNRDLGENYLLSENIINMIGYSNSNSLYFVLEENSKESRYDLKYIYDSENAKIHPLYQEDNDQTVYMVWQNELFERMRKDFITFLFEEFVKNRGLYF